MESRPGLRGPCRIETDEYWPVLAFLFLVLFEESVNCLMGVVGFL